MAYSEKVMDHFANPRNVGEMKDFSGVGEVGNPKCGDIMRMYIKVEGDTITDVSFMTFGCGAAIATSSMATELIKGKPISEALKLTNKAVMEALEVAREFNDTKRIEQENECVDTLKENGCTVTYPDIQEFKDYASTWYSDHPDVTADWDMDLYQTIQDAAK